MANRGLCAFCGEPVKAIETAAWPVTGWEVERSVGGANAIVGRERVNDGRIGHAVCARRAAERRRRGIADRQGSLL